MYAYDELSLVATKSAAGWSREFVKKVLIRWKAHQIVDDALLVVSELVTNAVEATREREKAEGWTRAGDIRLIGVRVLGLRSTVIIEVWDTSAEHPVPQEDDLDTEHGRGLTLVENLTYRWGTDPAPRGKVVWGEMHVLPHRHRIKEPTRPPAKALDAEFLQRLIDGLEQL
ncbi:ATP-binding protein [Streptomyces carminius]|uniref:ATP-binding protein n=1 Tax=Streptomyces carminius TaxID=2665496 RepID=UPI0011B42960|nr:ATP-binding protein [Streptomyces carminius]